MRRQIVIADSSKISAFKECPMRCNKQYNESITSLLGENKEAIAAGTYGHKLLERYYLGIFHGLGQFESAQKALEFDLDNEDKAEEKYPLSDENRKIVRDRFNKYWMLYSTRDFIPHFQSKPYHSITVNGNGTLSDEYGQSVEPLVEKGFSIKVLDTPEYLFVLEGRIDLISFDNSQPKWVDHKFQFRERNLYAKSIQFRNYALATGINLGIINYIRLHKNETDKTFIRQPIAFNPAEMRMWKEELITYFIEMAACQKSGVWPTNRDACSGKFGYECEYTAICDEPNEFVQLAIKENNYKKKVEWKPW